MHNLLYHIYIQIAIFSKTMKNRNSHHIFVQFAPKIMDIPVIDRFSGIKIPELLPIDDTPKIAEARGVPVKSCVFAIQIVYFILIFMLCIFVHIHYIADSLIHSKK